MAQNNNYLIDQNCVICSYHPETIDPKDLGTARGNTKRFLSTRFRLWKCPKCHTIHSIDPVDFADIYRDYPPNRRTLDKFAKGTLRNLLRRLEDAGLKKSDTILDYGCGNGVFVSFLRACGYQNVVGFDPFFADYAQAPTTLFDCVVANDVIEHVSSPRSMVAECARRVRPGGLLYIGTADSEPVKMMNTDAYLLVLHQPFHRVIFNQDTLIKLVNETEMTLITTWRRSYMDTLSPFANYRFLDEYNKALDYNMDDAMNPSSSKILLRRPDLFFYALFGYFFPSAWEPAVLLRKPKAPAT
jgi:2-polyprenyl-3-methyl-5-hydroxy-6-metoxy-1,4-benzoquinol methylase